MIDDKQYKLDIKQISKTLKYKDIDENIQYDVKNKIGLTHNQCGRFKLFPFTTKQDNIVLGFERVTGSFSRLIYNKEVKEKFDIDTFLEKIISKIHVYEGENSKEVFKDIIKKMFINEEELIDFDIRAINYKSSSYEEEKIGRFLISIFSGNELRDIISDCCEVEVNNILYKLVLNSLPELTNKKKKDEEYFCYLKFIRKIFIEDFKFLLQNEELYKSSLKRFLEYYYMFYISQTVMKLSQFEKADLNVPDKIYYTLSWESISKSRVSYRLGWQLLKGNIKSIFSHAITLEILNHHQLDEQMGYVELNELFNSLNEEEITLEIENIINSYTERITDIDWSTYKYKPKSDCSNGFESVYKLYSIIEYQFNKTGRITRSNDYSEWFIKFVYNNFGKRRGSLGYNLNITEEDIILMTKICIKNNEKLKLNLLFDEFEKRGLFFDRDSKTRIIQLFEKLNLLEKKSDSGDAQYVRSIL